jgi:multidrug transporter EmrE-like cation transporter
MIYIVLTILFTLYGQVITKWQVMLAGSLPTSYALKMNFLWHLLLNGWVISAFFAAFLASLAWMLAMTKLELSYAYPIVISSSYVMILICGAFFFHELITWHKIIGMLLVIIGIVVVGLR